MDLTFGIITDGNSDNYLRESINSIRNLGIPNYEVIVVGNTKLEPTKNLRVIQFDESKKSKWITRKKNLITELAKFEVVVFTHDYIVFEENWYEQIKKIKNFDLVMCEILNLDGKRFRDWILWVDNGEVFDLYLQRTRKCLLPYKVTDLTRYMYFSGTFWVAKKKFMLENPLNEKLSWGEMEDVEWSKRVRKKTKFVFAPGAKVSLLKAKEVEYVDADPYFVKALRQFSRKGKIKVPHKIFDEFGDLQLIPTSRKMRILLSPKTLRCYLLSNVLKITKHPRIRIN